MTKSIYSVHPSVKMVQDWVAGLKSKTGRSLDEWMTFIRKSGPAGEKERRDWLHMEFGLGTNSAWWLAERAEGKGFEDDDPDSYLQSAARYVDAMYAGPKAGLRPIHDVLIKLAKKLGKDVKVCPCKTIVPIYRNHVIAEIQPATRTRIDFGFALGAQKPVGRLLDTGGFAKKNRITHRIPLTSADEIDQDVSRWLRKAYDLDG